MEKLEKKLSTPKEELKETQNEKTLDTKTIKKEVSQKLGKEKKTEVLQKSNEEKKKEVPQKLNGEKKKEIHQNLNVEKKRDIPQNLTKGQKTAEKKPDKEASEKKQLKKYNEAGKKKKIIISIIIGFIIILAISLSTVFGIITSSSDKIISGVSVHGIDISGMTKAQAVEKLNNELLGNLNGELVLTHGDYSTTITPEVIEANYDVEKSVTEAFNVGRSGNNIFSKNFTVLKTMISKSDIVPSIKCNSELLDKKINEINKELPDRVIDPSYKIEENNLIVSSSSSGYRIQSDVLKNNILYALANNNSNVEIPVEKYHSDEVDIDLIYAEVRKDPIDASFTINPFEIKREENGIDFAISLDEARKIVSEKQESYTIPLKIIPAKVTVKTLPQEAFPDQLATYSTTYAASNYNRSTNIALASKAVNGIVLMPGETFSYNETLGPRTTAKGYKEAPAYSNGEVTTAVGGGICQVSSTLYNAVLLCNLEVVDRKNHTFEPSYVPAGQDATVSWQSPDFKFKNNREYPIRISATAGGGRVTFSIHGVKSDDDYVVKIQSSKTGTIPFTTQYVDDSSLPVGTTKVRQAGSNGCKSQTYKILYKNGKEVSRTLINSDTYKPHNQVIARGTKVVQTPVQEPTPEPNPTPTPTPEESSVTITTDVTPE